MPCAFLVTDHVIADLQDKFVIPVEGHGGAETSPRATS
jgi:hypothetical protein